MNIFKNYLLIYSIDSLSSHASLYSYMIFDLINEMEISACVYLLQFVYFSKQEIVLICGYLHLTWLPKDS